MQPGCCRRDDDQATRHDDDASPDDDDWLDAGTRRPVELYRSGVLPEPDLAQASLAELFAWCLAHAGDDPGLAPGNPGVQVGC